MISNRRESLFKSIISTIENDADVELVHTGKINMVRFYPKQLKEIPRVGDGSWDKSDYIVLYEIENRNNFVDIQFVIGPGDSSYRNNLYEIAIASNFIDTVRSKSISDKFTRIYRRRLLDENELSDLDDISIVKNFESAYLDFKKHDFLEINNSFLLINSLLVDVCHTVLTETETEAVRKIRIGHSALRRNMINRGYNKCLICDITNQNMLIMSHIKPWAICSHNERLDKDNVIMLCPNHDKLFELGYISIDQNSKIIVNSKILSEIEKYNVDTNRTLEINAENQMYLKWHRENKFSR